MESGTQDSCVSGNSLCAPREEALPWRVRRARVLSPRAPCPEGLAGVSAGAPFSAAPCIATWSRLPSRLPLRLVAVGPGRKAVARVSLLQTRVLGRGHREWSARVIQWPSPVWDSPWLWVSRGTGLLLGHPGLPLPGVPGSSVTLGCVPGQLGMEARGQAKTPHN